MTIRIRFKDGTHKEFNKFWALEDGGSYISLVKYSGGKTEVFSQRDISEVFIFFQDDKEDSLMEPK